MMHIKSIIYTLKTTNPWKTLYFNFHYFPFRMAIHLPIYVCWRTVLSKMGGGIVIDAPISRGMMKLGIRDLGIQDARFSRTIWQVYGTLVIKGVTNIGRGSKLCIGGGAKVVLGNRFRISGDTQIICQKEIVFGDNCLLSWDILIMDCDLHHLLNESSEVINSPKAIEIGNHVWVGCRSTILKGVTIPENAVVAASSTITRSIEKGNCVIGGNGKYVEILKEKINWNI